MALSASSCCSRHQEKAERYKRERDKYRSQLLHVHGRATQAQAEVQRLREQLELQGREGDLEGELSEMLQLLELLQRLEGL